MASGRREILAAYGALGRAASGLLMAGAAAFLLATLLAAPALAYVSVAAKAVAESLYDVAAEVEVAGSTMRAGEAASYLASYSISAGVAALLVSVAGIAVLTAAWACRRAETCTVGVARAAAAAWGALALVMFALIARGGPILEAPGYVTPLGIAGSLAAVAAGVLGGRLQRIAAALGVVAAVLLAVAVFQGGFPFKAGSVDVAWAGELAGRTQLGDAGVAARALAAFTQPSYPAWEKAPSIAAMADRVEAKLNAYKAEPSNSTATELGRVLSETASGLRRASNVLPEPLSMKAAELADRAQELAGERPPNVQAVEALVGDIRAFAEAAANHPPTRLNAAAHLEALALLYPGTMIAALVATAGGLSGNKRVTLILLAAGILLAGFFTAYASLRVYTSTSHVNSYIGELPPTLEARTSNVLWRGIATAAGLVRVTCVIGAVAGALIAVGGAIAAYIAAREA